MCAGPSWHGSSMANRTGLTAREIELRFSVERFETELRILRAHFLPKIHWGPCSCDACYVVRRLDEVLEGEQ